MLRPCRFPYASPDTRVRLVKQAHSLARFSKRTTEHRLRLLPTAGSPPGRFADGLLCPVAPSPRDFRPYCTSLFGVLFSVRSRYLFAIGLKLCLVLAVDACQVREGFPTPATREQTHDRTSAIRGCHPVSRSVPGDFSQTVGRLRSVRTPHCQRGRRPRRLRFGLRRVHSPLLTTSHSVSFPVRTEMFQFRTFPIAQGNCCGDSHSEILSSSPPCGSLRLIAAWHVLRRHLSRAIHHVAQ